MIQKNIRCLMLTAMILLAGGSVWGNTYYLDFRGVYNSFLQKNWIQTQNSTNLTAEVNSPEPGVITITTDFALGTTDATMIKYDVSFTGGTSQIQHIGSACMGANNCVRVIASGSYDFNGNPCDGASDKISFTTYAPSSSFSITTSTTGCSAIEPTSYSDVSSGSSVTFTVTPESGKTYSTATYSGGMSGSITKSGDTFTFNPTSGGQFTVVYSEKYTVTPSISGGTISPATPQSVTSGDNVVFTVTPKEGYEFSSYDAPAGWTVSPSSNTFTVTPTSSGTLSITYTGHSAPQVRIGEKPRFDADCGLTVGAYVAQTGCDNISAFNLQYSNNSMFRTDGSYKTAVKNQPVSSPDLNDNTNITLTSTEVEQVAKPGETLYLRVNATNGRTSEFSDVVPVEYVCNKFVTADLTKNFKACPGEHQFALRDMFLSPEPTTWSVTKGGKDAKADFTLVNGQLIWNTIGKTETSYTYVFTAKKDSYADGEAELTINYTVPPASSGAISTLVASASSVTPFTPVTLNATGTQGDIKMVEWTSAPATATFSNVSGNTVDADEPTATFKAGKVSSATKFTVTVTGYNDDCGSVSESVEINVTPDTAEDCD
ncbi:MAG: hypothetical protein J6P34_05595 [Paludibacteraceae bacterium]|nr:hypothetical protein [Paludibacteraceae bacterium]